VPDPDPSTGAVMLAGVVLETKSVPACTANVCGAVADVEA